MINSIPNPIIKRTMYHVVKNGNKRIINFISNENMPPKFKSILKQEIDYVQKMVESYNTFYN